MSTVPGLKINPDRLWKDLHYTCQWGTGERWGQEDHQTGMQRLALSDDDKKARDWFVSTAESLGCKVTVDSLGNTFAIRPGEKDGPPTVAGSHLDTQPTGGRYDGILGVHAGIEMLKVLQDNNIRTRYPVGVVNWTNEEGARFPCSMIASGVWAGAYTLEHAHSLADVDASGGTMGSELERIGYLGKVPTSHKSMRLAAHFELHIEQGPILEKEERKIGIVTGAQAYEWNYIHLKGRESHSGTTALQYRRDPLLAAAQMIRDANQVAKEYGGLATTGILKLKPGSINTIPGEVLFSLDVRAGQDSTLEQMLHEIRKQFSHIASTNGLVDITWTQTTKSQAVQFQKEAISCVRQACDKLFGEKTDQWTMDMISGAGHDSVYTSRYTPTAMIFVPCKDGISHNSREYCKKEDCANGAQVLMHSVLAYDTQRK